MTQSGKIRSVGVSNYTLAQMELLCERLGRPPATNQVEFHLLHMEPMYDGTFAQCERLRIRPMAWSPLAGGRLFHADEPAGGKLAAAAAKIGPRYDMAGLAELALAWVLAHPAGPVAVVGTSRPARIRSAAKAARLQLDRQDWYALWEAAQGRRIP